MKRLATEGLLRESGQEREGNRPTRQLYEITAAGHRALADIRRAGLSDVWFKYDPFGLALTRIDPATRDSLPHVIAERLNTVRAMLTETQQVNADARDHLGAAKQWALRHSEFRLEAEVAYLTELLQSAAEIVRDEHHPHERKTKPK